MATEDRGQAMETAEEMLRDDRAAAVRVTKETLDPDTLQFSSLTVLTKGAPEVRRKRVIPEDQAGPRCGAPQDMYSPQARETLARVLEDWLSRQGVTAFELLHRPDLAEVRQSAGAPQPPGEHALLGGDRRVLGYQLQDGEIDCFGRGPQERVVATLL